MQLRFRDTPELAELNQIKDEKGSDSDETTYEEDDDDFDPDSMEIPGGGLNLEQSKEIKSEIDEEPQPDLPDIKMENESEKPVAGPSRPVIKIEPNNFTNGVNAAAAAAKPTNWKIGQVTKGLENELNNELNYRNMFPNHIKQEEGQMPKTQQGNTLPESFNPFQLAASNFLSSYGGNPFASLLSQSGSNPSSGQQPVFDGTTNSILEQLNFQQQLTNIYSSPNILNKFSFDKFLANPALESLYRAVLGKKNYQKWIYYHFANCLSEQ